MSPVHSLASSKTAKLKGKSYQVRKQRINSLLEDLEANSPVHHLEHLKKQATLLSSMLKLMNIDQILLLSETEPDFLCHFGETNDDIDDWCHAAEFRIEDLLIKASKEVAERKAATQSGLKKLYTQVSMVMSLATSSSRRGGRKRSSQRGGLLHLSSQHSEKLFLH